MMEYERLTTNKYGSPMADCSKCEYGSPQFDCSGRDCAKVLTKRLAELEDKIEQGTLIELPCKVGDTVYVRGNTWDYYKSFYNQEFIGMEFFVVGKITSIRFTEKQILIKIKATYRENQRLCKKRDYPISTIGKTVFLTREEAEKCLKKLTESK